MVELSLKLAFHCLAHFSKVSCRFADSSSAFSLFGLSYLWRPQFGFSQSSVIALWFWLFRWVFDQAFFENAKFEAKSPTSGAALLRAQHSQLYQQVLACFRFLANFCFFQSVYLAQFRSARCKVRGWYSALVIFNRKSQRVCHNQLFSLKKLYNLGNPFLLFAVAQVLVSFAFLWLILSVVASYFHNQLRQSYEGQKRANIACRRTVCHVPFRGIFSLENIFRFVGWFSWQPAANACRWALPFKYLAVAEIHKEQQWANH